MSGSSLSAPKKCGAKSQGRVIGVSRFHTISHTISEVLQAKAEGAEVLWRQRKAVDEAVAFALPHVPNWSAPES